MERVVSTPTKILFAKSDGSWQPVEIIHTCVGLRRCLIKNWHTQLGTNHLDALEAGEIVAFNFDGYTHWCVKSHNFEI